MLGMTSLLTDTCPAQKVVIQTNWVADEESQASSKPEDRNFLKSLLVAWQQLPVKK